MLDDRYTANDHAFRANDPYAYAKYEITLDWLRGRPTGQALYHVGCGVGIFNTMAVQAGFNVTAFEPDEKVAEIARRNAPDGCTVHTAGVEDIEGEAVADVVVMHDVLEHIQNDLAAIGAIRRLLRPGGTLILSVPAMPSLYGYHDEQLGHFRRYTRRSLTRVLEPHFNISTIRSFGFAFIPVTLLVSRMLRRPYPAPSATNGLGVVSRALRLLCETERRVPLPAGTSLLVSAVAPPQAAARLDDQ